MTKQTKLIAGILAALAVLIAALLVFSRAGRQTGLETQEARTLIFTKNGAAVLTLTEDDIRALPSETFDATVRASGARPRPAVYRGVEIHELIKAAGVSADEISSLVFNGADLYVTTVQTEELSEYGNIYIAFECDGEPMKSRADGGDGPFQVIVLNDYYSLRWCKYLSEVEIVE